MHPVVDQALRLIKRGDPAAACALLAPLTVAPAPDAAALRLHAAALAQLGDLEQALRIIEIAMRSALLDPTTRALAARIYEDAQSWEAAFGQYVWLARAQPSQGAFLRGVWRIARAATLPDFEQRALRFTRELDFDVGADTILAWAVTTAILQQPLTEASAREIKAICDRVFTQSNQDTSARWLRLNRTIVCEPEHALSVAHEITIDVPTNADDVNAMLVMPQQFAQTDSISAWRRRYQMNLQTLVKLPTIATEWLQSTAFYLAYHGRDDTELQRLRGDLLQKAVSPIGFAIDAMNKGITRPQKPLPRVAFVSKHIRDCTVGHYFQRLITELNPVDQKLFEIWVYACNKPDALTDAMATRVETLQIISVPANTDNDANTLRDIASRIANDHIDVLIYPEVGMEPLIEKLAALRLAPTQCAMWGHPVTTGLPTIDIFFSAASMEPGDADKHYRERLQRLPGLGTNYPKPPKPDLRSRAALGLPMGAPLVVCMQSSFKWSPDFMLAVADVLSRQLTAKLVYFINREPASAYVFERALRCAFDQYNLDFNQRVHGIAEVERTRFLSVLAECDLALDTFGFSGGNTSLDALSVGLPVLTLPGEFMRGRQTMAMLQIVDASELVANDRDGYIARAVQLIEHSVNADADDSTLREKVARNAHRLFDDPAPVLALREHLQKLTQSAKQSTS